MKHLLLKVLASTAALVAIFIASVYLAYYFGGAYTRLIRYLYESLSDHKVSFTPPKINFHLASTQFVYAYAIYKVTLTLLLYPLTKKQRFIVLLSGIGLLILSTIAFCDIDAAVKLATCSACEDGKIDLRYSEVNYDLILRTTLIFALIPAIIYNIIRIKKARNFNHSGIKQVANIKYKI